MQAKKDFVLQVICNGINLFEEIKKETNYSYPDLMNALKELILEQKIIKATSYPMEFYAIETISKDLKEMNSLMVGTCCIKH
jgi:hypothetical protein